MVPNIIITDKECVDKTYPDFWYDLEHRFGVKLSVPSTEKEKAASSPQDEKADHSIYAEDHPSIVIVGMRGSGKTNMGKALAECLKWKFIDMDSEFESFAGASIKDFVAQNGWPSFRTKEEELVRKVIQGSPRQAVVSTGGGIVETPTALEYLFSKKKVL